MDSLSDAEHALIDLFTYQPSDPGMQEKFEAISTACCAAALACYRTMDPGPERTLVIRKLIEARMLANMSIVFKGQVPIPR